MKEDKESEQEFFAHCKDFGVCQDILANPANVGFFNISRKCKPPAGTTPWTVLCMSRLILDQSKLQQQVQALVKEINERKNTLALAYVEMARPCVCG